jgi:hypothetical protein
MNPKISEQQQSKPAYIYVRQSTLAQVRHHQESTERQYALRKKALELGWSETSIRILDRDLGVSGAHATGRADFKTLVADVSMLPRGGMDSAMFHELAFGFLKRQLIFSTGLRPGNEPQIQVPSRVSHAFSDRSRQRLKLRTSCLRWRR